MAQSRKNPTRLIRTVAAFGTILALAAFIVFMLPSGCGIPGGCGGACLDKPSRFPCTIYDAGVCPVDAGHCVVAGQCSCIPGRPDCDIGKCFYSTTEDACRAAVACQWSVGCANVVTCGPLGEQDLCNSHPECYYQADKGC
jgi:hypothetical protein